jgi:hypothetical protein
MKVEGVTQIFNYHENTIERALLLENLPMNSEINAVIKAIEGKSLSQNNGILQTTENQYAVISSQYGIIKLPLHDDSLINQLMVNQSISIGIYDMPDRANMLKLKITTHGVTRCDDKIYQFLFMRENSHHQPLQNGDILDITQTNITQKLYQLLLMDNAGHKLNINLELNNSGNDRVFLEGENIVVKINDILYRVIEEVPSLKKLLSLGAQTAVLTVNQEFNLKEDFTHLIEILPKTIPIQTLIDATLFMPFFQAPASLPTSYLGIYISMFLPVFHQMRNAKLQIKESRGTCKSFRLIFEFELKDGSLSIIDCFYMSSTNALNIVVRSEYELMPDIKADVISAINHIVSVMSFSVSVAFSIQSNEDLCQIVNNSSSQNYTYTV